MSSPSQSDAEEQEEPSSSNIPIDIDPDIRAALDALSVADNVEVKEEDPLSTFRQQWQRELVSTPSPQRQMPAVKREILNAKVEPGNEEEKAKQLFRRGIDLERCGKLYEAVQHYKRAVQLCPDVERRLYESADTRGDGREETPAVEIPDEATSRPESLSGDGSEEEEGADLVARFTRILARKDRFCEPEVPQKGAHISWLPAELVLTLLRWVVSVELDAASLARCGAASRGLYLAARAHDLWRALCLRTWGVDCGTPRMHEYATWRDMYVCRARLNLSGCYISKTTYLRHGENAYQDQFYKPWYLIEYYRYLRFFPEGLVLSWTTAEEPAACVAHLKHRAPRNLPGILSGHYRLVGDKVVIVLKKQADRKPAQASNTRFRSRRKDAAIDQHDQMFHMELQLRSSKSRRNSQLAWRRYSVSSRRDRELWTNFELPPSKFPPFVFSTVRQYAAESDAPLA